MPGAKEVAARTSGRLKFLYHPFVAQVRIERGERRGDATHSSITGVVGSRWWIVSHTMVPITPRRLVGTPPNLARGTGPGQVVRDAVERPVLRVA